MKRILLTLAAFALLVLPCATVRAADVLSLNLWAGAAPDESSAADAPSLDVWIPANQTSETCVLVLPGGAYQNLDLKEGAWVAKHFNERGIAAAVLHYRVPRREGRPKHLAPWQDAQRAVRILRSRAVEWGFSPDKIGVLGWSAGGHLALMASTTSLTNAYEPVDELDKLPCSVNFAIPIYPAYVLEDGADGPNAGKGNDSPMVGDFSFDAATPPTCLFHGDADAYSPMGSVAVYGRLRKLNVPAELHIYACIPHGFAGHAADDHVGDWINRVDAWMTKLGF